MDKCRSLRPGEPADPTEKGVDAPDCRRYEGALQSVRQAVSAAPAEKAVKRRAVSADGGKLPDLPCASEGQEFCLTVAGNCCTPCAAAAANGAAELAKRLECACLLALSDNNTPPRGATVPSQLLRNHRLGCSDRDTSVGWQASSRPRPHRKPRLPKPQARDGVGAVPPMDAVEGLPHEALWRVGFHPDLMAMIEWRAWFHPGPRDRRGSSRFRRCTAGRPVYLCPIPFESARAWRLDAGHSAL